MEQLLTLNEAAKALRLSPSRLWELTKQGGVRGRRINGKGRFLFTQADLEAALQPSTVSESDVELSAGAAR